ncbi:chemotaxis protein CheB [Methylobacterium sp. DM1]|nr:chemotaxis protein CheB [Methylobacterium sp. DM1]
MDGTGKPWFVAIGASGGDGLDDIKAVLRELPSSLNAVVLIVLHRLWDQPSHLAAVLGRAAHMPVCVALNGNRFTPGTAYIGEPADHLALAANSFGRLVNDPARTHRNRTVDLLFRSVAAYGGSRIIGVVLSGSLDDGSRGLAAINEIGGLSMVVTPARPPERGMPENAIAYDGPIDLIGSPSEIARAICAAVQQP